MWLFGTLYLYLLTDWLVGWLIDWLVNWLINWLTDCKIPGLGRSLWVARTPPIPALPKKMQVLKMLALNISEYVL